MKLINPRYIVAIMAFLGLLSYSAKAQLLNERDLLLQPTELLNESYTGNAHGAYIQQIGEGNELELLQLQQGMEGNLARVLQSGDANKAIIAQSGSGNQLALIQQGDLNIYELSNLGGAGNRLVGIQQGNGNLIHQELIQSNQIYSEMVQIGNNNEIITIIEGLNNREFKIRQIGDGLKVTIRESGN